ALLLGVHPLGVPLTHDVASNFVVDRLAAPAPGNAPGASAVWHPTLLHGDAAPTFTARKTFSAPRAAVALPLQRATEKINGVIAPGEAWERGKRCNDYASETFRRGSVGSQSHPVELASSRK